MAFVRVTPVISGEISPVPPSWLALVADTILIKRISSNWTGFPALSIAQEISKASPPLPSKASGV